MASEELPEPERKGLAIWVRRFPQVHLGIGLTGNALFVVGSILFLAKQQHVGLYFFLTGSIGMFLGQLGEVIRYAGRHRLRRFDIDPWGSGSQSQPQSDA